MPVKIARSAPRPSFGLPQLLVASTPRVSLATRAERREYSRQFRSHPGNPGLIELGTKMTRDTGQDYDCEGELKVNYDDSPDRDEAVTD